jgi:predicted DCC family thiol-disulfide oxidoreductase YuxK
VSNRQVPLLNHRYPSDVREATIVILYDADCGLCRWSADRLKRWDSRGALAFASIQSANGQELLHAIPEEARLDSMHAVTNDGRVWSGGEALRVLLEALPAGTVPATIAGAFPEATEHVYRFVARHRERLGAWLGQDACDVDPSGTAP